MKNMLLIVTALLLSSVASANEKSLYNFSWLDNDKEIYVLQNRKFRKVDNFYIGGTLAYNLSQDFLDVFGGTARAGYFFSENWGIEGVFAGNSSTESDTAKGVKAQGAFPFYRDIKSYMGAMAMWSPFYSKINTFNKVFYFDWQFGLGVASIATEDNRKLFDSSIPASEQTKLTAENSIGALWSTGFRFYINEHWSARLDITGVSYKAEKTNGDESGNKSTISKLFTNYDLGLGLNYAF